MRYIVEYEIHTQISCVLRIHFVFYKLELLTVLPCLAIYRNSCDFWTPFCDFD